MSACNENKQREANGRFAKGNRGGPGNPFTREVGALRRRMMAAVTPEEIEDAILVLMHEARSGNIAACKLVLELAVGKPGKDGVWWVEDEVKEECDVEVAEVESPLPTGVTVPLPASSPTTVTELVQSALPSPTVITVGDHLVRPMLTVVTVPGVQLAAPSPTVVMVAALCMPPLPTVETVGEFDGAYRSPSRNGEIRIDSPPGFPHTWQTRDISARGG